MDNIHRSGPIQPHIPSTETGATAHSSGRDKSLLERAPSSLRAFTEQLSEALQPLHTEQEGLKSTVLGGHMLETAIKHLHDGDPQGGLALLKEAQSLPSLPKALGALLSQSEAILNKGGAQEPLLSGLKTLNKAYMQKASMHAMDFSHKIIKNGESLGRITMDLKALLEKTKL